ncbi:TIGR02587 family membrane protein [Gloeocapsopsis crepidinum LEGE 06123]|uniref:TIGR02587 family membrane protein n=1 Tax=Gloeocapsopsis crepidinum LEGE 06123 TaxID=588587 RepID=A0ABR9UKR5_9CHRO|nr:TIGR02587 family membrane protein [Gloeocapsopsis crepidinum]MBE9188876.1 TIGR02587 family membrane protein [Gloeocapsopsis crepidinum LEGE 06123]
MNDQSQQQRSLVRSLQEYLRGIAGGLLFSLPLLYTMEVWWAGFITHPLRLLIYVLATFSLLLGYNRYGGLRRSASPLEVAIDSVEEMGLGLIIAAIFLWLLGRITAEMTLNEIAGKIIIEAMTVAIGVSVGTAQLGGGEGKQQTDSGMKSNSSLDDPDPTPFLTKSNGDFGGQLTIALCGAVLFAANVAPTEEIIQIAVESNSWRLVGFAFVSMLLGAMILFYSNFTGTQRFSKKRGIVNVIYGTVVTYAIALVASAAILWFFGRFDNMSLITCLAQTVVLGLAATLGASAGRLLLQ